MKNLYLVLFVLVLLPGAVYPQNWTAGIPVNTTLIDFPDNIFVSQMCDTMSGQEAEFRIALPAVDGVNYFAVVDFMLSASHVVELRQGANTQVVGIGDSMQIIPTYPVDTIHLSYAGFQTEVSVKFAAEGIPATPGQLHPCGSTNDGWYYLPIGCLMPIFPDQATYLTNCVVQGFTGLPDPDDEVHLTVSPNPSTGFYTLACNRLISSVQITDITGKMIRKKDNDPSLMHFIDLHDLPDGCYFITCEFLQGRSNTLKLALVH